MGMRQPYKYFERFCERTGMRFVNIHSFRHFNASVLINNGVDVKTVQGCLGHSCATTTIPVPNSNTNPMQYLPAIILISKGRFSRSYARNLPHFFRSLIQFPSAKFTIFLHCFSVYCTPKDIWWKI